jgi:K+-sensing histidine kinase KdpD
MPENEVERLRALEELEILDTLPEAAIDRIARLAAHLIGVPIVLVSLVDAERQWFKSRVGFGAEAMPRELAFCSHAILSSEVFVVPDARSDARFADNPMVTGSPGIRFYAGAPLMLTDDVRLGTLCAIDCKPRDLSPDEAAVLRDLAAVVVDEFRLCKSLKTEREAVVALQAEAQELRLANDALDHFAHIASHNLRSPLKTIINVADIALLDAGEEPEELLRRIRTSAAVLEEVVAGYRRLAKLERARTEQRLVSELIEEAREHAAGSIVTEVRSDAALSCDPALMTQVFTNLIENARNHGSEARLLIEANSDDESILVRASNPVHEPLAVDRSVFVPFRRLATDREGTGLGLAIVDRVARLHGGSVSASCEDRIFSIEMRLPKQAVLA